MSIVRRIESPGFGTFVSEQLALRTAERVDAELGHAVLPRRYLSNAASTPDWPIRSPAT